MSDEFDPNSEPRFTSFIPLTIALSGFIIWFLFQDYGLNAQRSALNRNFQAALPTISEAQQVSQRYVSLMRDLVKTAQTDDAAKTIVNDAIKAGLIRVQPNANAAPDASAPTSTSTGT
jgi:hypothetical protein